MLECVDPPCITCGTRQAAFDGSRVDIPDRTICVGCMNSQHECVCDTEPSTRKEG